MRDQSSDTALDVSRFPSVVVPRFSFRVPKVINVLEEVCGMVGYPASIGVDEAKNSSFAIST